MKVVVGADKGGMKLRDAVKELLEGQGHEVIDCGTYDENEPMPHTAVAEAAARKIQSGEAERGVLVCGTGMGMSLTANKFKGVYAAVVESKFAAEHCRYINKCNVLCIGAYIMGEYMAKEIVDSFMKSDFAPGFEEKRRAILQGQYERILEIENENFK